MLVPDGGGGGPAPTPHYGDGPIGGGTTHLTQAQATAEASHIHSVGDRTLRTDDYNARMRAFAKEMGTLDSDSAKRLFEAVLKQDPGAMQSWLQGSRLLDQVSDPTQKAAVVDAYAQAYHDGKAGSSWDALDFLTGGQSLAAVQGGPGLASGAIAKMDDVLAAGDHWDTDSLRQTVAGQLVHQDALNTRAPITDFGAAALAVHLTSGSSDPSMTARMFAALNADQRGQVFQEVSQAGNVYARLGQQDPMTQLVNSVDYQGSSHPLAKTSDGKNYGQLAVEMIRDANQKDDEGTSTLYPDMEHDRTADPGRAAAFSQLFADNKTTVLNTMLDPRDLKLDPAVNDGRTSYIAEDAMALGNLFRATALESKNPGQPQMLGALKSYIGEQRAALKSRNPEAKDQAEIRLGGLAAVSSDAVLQLKTSIDGDNANKGAIISFLVDTAVSALPGGGSAEHVVDAVVSRTFGDGVAAQLTKQVGTHLVDQATGQLTEKAKGELTRLVGQQGASLFEKTSLANALHEAIYGDAKELGVENDIDSASTVVTDQLQYARHG